MRPDWTPQDVIAQIFLPPLVSEFPQAPPPAFILKEPKIHRAHSAPVMDRPARSGRRNPGIHQSVHIGLRSERPALLLESSESAEVITAPRAAAPSSRIWTPPRVAHGLGALLHRPCP